MVTIWIMVHDPVVDSVINEIKALLEADVEES